MRAVYNGYTEKFLTGKELKEMFFNAFYCGDKHHSTIYDITIPEYFSYIKIKDDKTYRVFFNDMFCKIMNSKTDGNIGFFSYVFPDYINDAVKTRLSLIHKCPKCESEMILKIGPYGPFWSCSNYPNCKGAQTIYPMNEYTIHKLIYGDEID